MKIEVVDVSEPDEIDFERWCDDNELKLVVCRTYYVYEKKQSVSYKVGLYNHGYNVRCVSWPRIGNYTQQDFRVLVYDSNIETCLHFICVNISGEFINNGEQTYLKVPDRLRVSQTTIEKINRCLNSDNGNGTS